MSIVQLIATPEKFDGKAVSVIGFLCVAFENDAIYLHREDFEHGMPRNALWVDIPEEKRRDESLNMHYVILQGTFQASLHGHMGMFAGAITHVTRLDNWFDKPRK